MIILNDALHITSKEISRHDLFELIKNWAEKHIILAWLPSIRQIDFYHGTGWGTDCWFRVFFSDKNEDMIEFKNDIPIEYLLEEYVNEGKT